MGWTALCKKRLLSPGEAVPCRADGQEIILLWPEGGRPRAFDARCPHEDVSLNKGIFNGQTLICAAHGWVFDAHSGEGLSPTGCELAEFPIRVNGEMLEIELTED